MKGADFKEWLATQGLVESSIATRLSDTRRVEALYGDLDAAFEADRLEAILASLAYSAADLAAARPNPSRLPINGDLNDGLATYRAAVNAYGRFRMESEAALGGGTRSTTAWAEAELRRRYDDPSTDNAKMVAFHLKDGRAVALQRDAPGVQLWLEEDVARGMPSALTVRRYLAAQPRHSNLPVRLRHAPPGGGAPRPVALVTIGERDELRALLDWYDGGGAGLNRAALARLRDVFLAKYPDFRSFEDAAGYAPEEDAYKRRVIAEALRLVTNRGADTDAVLGGALLDLAASKQHNLLGYFKTYELLKEWRLRSGEAFDAAAGALVRPDDDLPAAAQAFVDAVWPIMAEGQASRPYGDSRIIATLLLALTRPTGAVFVRTTPFNNAAIMLLGRKLYGWNPLTADEYAATLAMADAVLAVLREEWGWRPRDLWDVQGFLWCTCQTVPGHQPGPEPTPAIETVAMSKPINLILYGPPGTGKTYATAAHAVRLCDGLGLDDPLFSPANREALMTRYAELAAAERIEFVTFHQTTAYEEFVEGLRPDTGSSDGDVADGEATSGGFRLRPRDGIFKDVSERARLSVGPGGAPHLDRQRRVFKVALGRRGDEEDRIDEGLERGLIHLGWGGEIDWSEERFDSFAGIKRHWQEDVDPSATGKDPNIEVTFAFRVWMRVGDYVILSDGRDLVRGVAEVTGEYFYDPAASYHPHRRDVRWLWQDAAGVPRERVYARQFRRHSVYQLADEALDWEALDALVFGEAEQGEGLSHVLVIDKINRANISKVFGELITLLEPDKRIGTKNELRVRLPYSGDTFGVPANLHVIGTMNTADRSIALLDTALRRRFTFEELMPDPTLLGTVGGIHLTALNDRIEYLFDREHQIGHAYFLPCETADDVHHVMRHKVIPLLQEYFYEDWTKVAAVLGDVFADDGRRHEGGFLIRTPLASPFGTDEDEDRTRYRWTVRDSATFTYARLAG